MSTYRRFKTKEKSRLCALRVYAALTGMSALQEWIDTDFVWTFKWDFAKAVIHVCRAVCLQKCLFRELALSLLFCDAGPSLLSSLPSVMFCDIDESVWVYIWQDAVFLISYLYYTTMVHLHSRSGKVLQVGLTSFFCEIFRLKDIHTSFRINRSFLNYLSLFLKVSLGAHTFISKWDSFTSKLNSLPYK